MLDAGEDVLISGSAQAVDQVLVVVGEFPAAMGEAEHAGVVGRLAGEQGGPRRRTRRRGAKGLAEEHALGGEELESWRRSGVTIRLNAAAGVVGVEVKN